MPRMDGFTFAVTTDPARLMSRASGAMISTESGVQDIAEARMLGANFYLVKPVAEAELVRHVCVLTGATL